MTGNDLRFERERLGLTQARLAELCEMAQSEISRAENRGDAPLTKGTAARVQLGLDAATKARRRKRA